VNLCTEMEKPLHIKIDASVLDPGRLDAEHYDIAYIENAIRISRFGATTTLERCRRSEIPIRRGIDMPEFSNDVSDPILVPIAAFGSPGLELDGLNRIRKAQHDLFPGSHIQPGDLLVAMGGYAGHAAICPPDTPVCNIGRHTARVAIDSERADRYYLWAFITSNPGTLQFKRQITGSVQAGINLADLRQVEIPAPNPQAQIYIGNKVRQAERLRAWAKAALDRLQVLMDKYQPEFIVSQTRQAWVEPTLLTDLLTASTYRQTYIANQRNLRKKHKPNSLLSFFKSVANGFDEREVVARGLPYLKVANVRRDYLDLVGCGRIAFSSLELASKEQIPSVGDLLITRKGSFGIASVVVEPVSFLTSSEVFVCKPKEAALMPMLSEFLNSPAGQMQFWQFSTGTTMPGINQQNMRHILVPTFEDRDQAEFAEVYAERFWSRRIAINLTTAAKLLVEALIEGQLTEADLIAAQQALEAGDDGPDRAILARLTADGLDGSGAPVFPDLDRLATLLARAESEAAGDAG
jgi:type I restriction enzyme, S subunit